MPQKIHIALPLIVGLIVVGVFIFLDIRTPNSNTIETADTADDTDETFKSTSTPPDITVRSVSEGTAAEEIEIENSTAIPNIDREIVIPDFYPPSAAMNMREKIALARGEIENDPSLFESWLILGNLYNDIHDWEGAIEIYEFLNETSPENSITFVNAGNLYHLHLKDFPKAETNFRQAIINNPTNQIAYSSFHELYKYSYKQDSTLAVDILKEGLAALPGNVNFVIQIATYYRDTGDTENARIYYIEAKEQALKDGNTELSDLIDIELQDL